MLQAERELVAKLLDTAGQTYAEQAGIKLADKPAPLYQLLVLSLLLSTRISADIALAAARELSAAGYRTARRMQQASWQARVDALGRAHYRRYDESATRLGDGAELLLDRYGGDLRRLAAAAEHGVEETSQLLRQMPGIGPVGASIFLREAQAVWPWLRPYIDDRVRRATTDLGLPDAPDTLAELAGTTDLSRLSAALVHVSLDRRLRAKLR